MELGNGREMNDVNNVLSLAKLTKNDVLPASQALFFTSSDNQTGNFLLLELNNELLKDIEQNNPLCIKGCDDDDLVICSETSTYHVLGAETSNSLLLVNPANSFSDIKDNKEGQVRTVKVCEIFHEYLEATSGKPSLNRLYEILRNSVYKGPEHENEIDSAQLFTQADLMNIIQASDKELSEALDSLNIVEVDGHIREIDFEYHFRVLSYMLKLIEENSWTLDMVDYNETSDALKDFIPEEIISSLFHKYTAKSKMIDGIQLYKYKEDEVCQFFARVILRTAGRFNLDEFLQAWAESVPEGMVPTENMLYGIAIINRQATPKVIWAFEEHTLPNNISDRFHVLFEAKEKWTVPEIAPYIRPLTGNKLDVKALLSKHARACTENGVKYYLAKHLK